MTFIDLLTGWPEALSTKDSTAKTAPEVFLYQIVWRVDRLHTDRGATFLSELFREITSRVACKQIFTTGGMPTGNARVERMHRTIENIIGCYITEGHENWPDLVPVALWTKRSTTGVRTGFSPFNLTFGRDPISMGLPEVGNAPESLNDHEWFMQTRDNIALFRHIAQDVVKKYEKGMRDKLDEHARPVQFLEGDLVYMYDPTATENTASKFSNVYRGPYRVVTVKGDNLVRITSLATGKEIPHFINIQKLKRAYGPWSPALTKPTNKNHPNNKEVSDQSREFHAQPEPDKAEYLTGGASAENWVDPPAALNMESPHIHGGPTINHEKSPGRQNAGQLLNQSTDHNSKSTSEMRPAGKRKRGRKKGLKTGGVQEPSKETGTMPFKTQVTKGQTKRQVTSGKKASSTQDHEEDADPLPDKTKNGDQRIPSRYNLRNAKTPVSYTQYFENMDNEEWKNTAKMVREGQTPY